MLGKKATASYRPFASSNVSMVLFTMVWITAATTNTKIQVSYEVTMDEPLICRLPVVMTSSDIEADHEHVSYGKKAKQQENGID